MLGESTRPFWIFVLFTYDLQAVYRGRIPIRALPYFIISQLRVLVRCAETILSHLLICRSRIIIIENRTRGTRDNHFIVSLCSCHSLYHRAHDSNSYPLAKSSQSSRRSHHSTPLCNYSPHFPPGLSIFHGSASFHAVHKNVQRCITSSRTRVTWTQQSLSGDPEGSAKTVKWI